MSSAAQYHPLYIFNEYQQWEGDWELWQGVPVASPSPGFRHQQVAAEVFAGWRSALQQAGCQECRVLYALDWRIANDMVVRPDIALVCGEISSDYLESAPRLIVEVLSPATAHKDRTAKHALYQQQGVAYYLLVDPTTSELEAWHLESNKRISLDHRAPCEFQLTPGCNVTPDFSQIFV